CVPHRDAPSFPTRRSSDLVRLLALQILSEGIDDSSEEFNHIEAGEIMDFAPTLQSLSQQDDKAIRELAAKLLSDVMQASNANDRSEEHTSELQSRVDLVCR